MGPGGWGVIGLCNRRKKEGKKKKWRLLNPFRLWLSAADGVVREVSDSHYEWKSDHLSCAHVVHK